MCGHMQLCSHELMCECREALADEVSVCVKGLQANEADLEAHRTARGFHEPEQQEGDRIKYSYHAVIEHLLKQVDAERSSL